MADVPNKWAMNADKLAYGIAGLLSLIVLCLPLFSGQDNTALLNTNRDELLRKIQDQKIEKPEAPNVAAIIEKQWTPGPALDLNPEWRTEREPVFVKKLEKEPELRGIHEPSVIDSITCERDGKTRTVYLAIKGKLSEKNEYVLVRKIEVLRKEGDGEPVLVKAVDVAPEFEVKDFAVIPGKAYTYLVRTTAVGDPKAGDGLKFDPKADGVKTSEGLGPTPSVPYDYSLVIQPLAPGGDPQFVAKLNYYDYKQNKVVESGIRVYKEKETFADGRYEVFTVDQAAGKVTIRVAKGTAKETLGPTREHRPVAAWEPVTGGGAAPAGDGGEAAAEPPAAEPAAAPPKASPPKPAAAAPPKGAPKADPKAAPKAGPKAKSKGGFK